MVSVGDSDNILPAFFLERMGNNAIGLQISEEPQRAIYSAKQLMWCIYNSFFHRVCILCLVSVIAEILLGY